MKEPPLRLLGLPFEHTVEGFFYMGAYQTNFRRRHFPAWRPKRRSLRFHLMIIKDRFRSDWK